MKDQRGFTLLELLMVVVIIAILASIAVPQYIKTTERARMSEALTNLSSLRQSAIRFKAEVSSAWTGAVPGNFDFNPAETSGTRIYAYNVACATANDIVFAAKRLPAGAGPPPIPALPASCVADYVISINSQGAVIGRDCQSAAAQACL